MHVIIVTIHFAILEGIQNVTSTLKPFARNP